MAEKTLVPAEKPAARKVLQALKDRINEDILICARMGRNTQGHHRALLVLAEFENDEALASTGTTLKEVTG